MLSKREKCSHCKTNSWKEFPEKENPRKENMFIFRKKTFIHKFVFRNCFFRKINFLLLFLYSSLLLNYLPYLSLVSSPFICKKINTRNSNPSPKVAQHGIFRNYEDWNMENTFSNLNHLFFKFLNTSFSRMPFNFFVSLFTLGFFFFVFFPVICLLEG